MDLRSHLSSPFSVLQKAIAILLQHATVVEGLFTVTVCEDEALATWSNLRTNLLRDHSPEQRITEKELHSLAAGVLLELKKLNGSLMTDQRHDRFVAAAAIPNKYSQLYVYRLLLGSLPPVNYSVLKNLSFLLRCITFKNTSRISEQVIIIFGRLLISNREGVTFVHRQQTAADVGTLLTVILIEEWNYLFQYGRATFYSCAKAETTLSTHSRTGSLKSLEGLHATSKNVLLSETWWDMLPSKMQNDNSHSSHRYPDLSRKIGSSNLEIKSTAAPTKSSKETRSKINEEFSERKSVSTPVSEVGTVSYEDQKVKNEPEVSCYGPSYWKHWFEESDLKLCKNILKYALSMTRTKPKFQSENLKRSRSESERNFLCGQRACQCHESCMNKRAHNSIGTVGALASSNWSMSSGSNILFKKNGNQEEITFEDPLDVGASLEQLQEECGSEAVYFNQRGFSLSCFSPFCTAKVGLKNVTSSRSSAERRVKLNSLTTRVSSKLRSHRQIMSSGKVLQTCQSRLTSPHTASRDWLHDTSKLLLGPRVVRLNQNDPSCSLPREVNNYEYGWSQYTPLGSANGHETDVFQRKKGTMTTAFAEDYVPDGSNKISSQKNLFSQRRTTGATSQAVEARPTYDSYISNSPYSHLTRLDFQDSHSMVQHDVEKSKVQPKELACSFGLSDDCLERLQKFVVSATKVKVVEELQLKATIDQLLSVDLGKATVDGLADEEFHSEHKTEEEFDPKAKVNKSFSSKAKLTNEAECIPQKPETHHRDNMKAASKTLKPSFSVLPSETAQGVSNFDKSHLPLCEGSSAKPLEKSKVEEALPVVNDIRTSSQQQHIFRPSKTVYVIDDENKTSSSTAAIPCIFPNSDEDRDKYRPLSGSCPVDLPQNRVSQAPLTSVAPKPPPPPPPPLPRFSSQVPPLPPLKPLITTQPIAKTESSVSHETFRDVPAGHCKRPKMKQLVWDKITGPLAEETVWKSATSSSVQMDLRELESLFCIKDTFDNECPKKKASKRKKDQGVQVLDHKRAHNVGIQLRSLRRPVLELCQALRDKDLTVLNMEVLNVLLNTLPSEDDLMLLKSYQGEYSKLAEVEKYYLELSTIPRFEKIIKAFIFKGQYSMSYKQIYQELKLLEQACNHLKESQTFLKILEMVLAVGNHLNGDSLRGGARGFKLATLLKLMDVKSHRKKTTLMHFVVAELLRTDETVGRLADELKSVKVAANLSLERLQSGVRELENGLDLIKAEISPAAENTKESSESLKSDTEERQYLVDIMLPFYFETEAEVKNLRSQYESVVRKLKDLAAYYGENLKDERLIDLFKTMREFLFMFDQVYAEIKARRREDEGVSKRSAFYSCPTSPARASRCDSAAMRETASPPNFQQCSRSPIDEGRAEQTDRSISALPEKQPDQQESEKQCLSTTRRKSLLHPVSSEPKGKDSDPVRSTNVCYDSDWSTG